MNRCLRVVVAALALLLLVAGTAFATRSPLADQRSSLVAASHRPSSPQADESEPADPTESPEGASPEAQDPAKTEPSTAAPDASGAPLSDAHAQQLVDLLKAQGIDATVSELQSLAAKYGVGGAVRLESWASASGKPVSDIAAMFDGGMGWGQIAQQLEQADSSLHLSPGIGWIMGHGHGNAKGGNGQGHGNPHSST
jgi:hypothetical protein